MTDPVLWAAYEASRSATDRNAIVEANLDLVAEVAAPWLRRCPASEGDDIRSDAALGLIVAVEGYVPAAGPFEPYAALRIRGAIKDGFRRRDHLTRVGRRIVHVDDERAQSPASLDAPITDGEAATVANLLGCVDHRFTERELAADLAPALAWLARTHPEHHAVLMRMANGAPLRQLATERGVTIQRVSQIRRDAVAMVRRILDGGAARAA